MGTKQSSPAAANGRTRAYSGSDLPSNTGGGGGGGRASPAVAPSRYHHGYTSVPHRGASGATPSPPQHSRGPGAARSAAAGGRSGSSRAQQSGINIPNSGGSSRRSPQQSAGSTPPDERSNGGQGGGPRLLIGSLPAHLSPHLFGGFQCPVCSRFIPTDEIDLHLVMCLTKPRITYNEDVLTKDGGECAICLEDLSQGDTIARLPCLCVYHKGCIDEWFEVNRSCPEHPSD